MAWKFFRRPQPAPESASPSGAEASEPAGPLSERDSFEQRKMSRRAALRRMGVMTGAAVLGMVSLDDLARLSAEKLKEQEATKAIGEAVAQEFRSAGVVIATTLDDQYDYEYMALRRPPHPASAKTMCQEDRGSTAKRA